MKRSFFLLSFLLTFALLSYANVADPPDDNTPISQAITKVANPAAVSLAAGAAELEFQRAILANEKLSDELVMNASVKPESSVSAVPEVKLDQATPGPDDPPTVASYSEWYMVIYGALILLFGELGKIFGWKDKLPKYRYVFVVIAFGVVAGAGFLWHGMSFLMVFLTLASSLGIYDVLAGLLKKKPVTT